MGTKTAISALWLLLLGLTNGSIEVNMTGAWKPNVGWEMECIWSLERAPLQSVRLYLDDEQFLVFRPETFGRNFSSTFEPLSGGRRMKVHCHDMGLKGSCAIEVELLTAPMFDAVYKCEVSEEAPKFQIEEAQYLLGVFVPPTHPRLEERHVNGTIEVNCSSAGIPAPRLRWRVADNRIQETFSNRKWDFRSKLWHSWSVVSILQPSELPLACTATVERSGRAAELTTELYLNSVGQLKGMMTLLGLSALMTLR